MPLEILAGDFRGTQRYFVAGRVMAFIDVSRLGPGFLRAGLTAQTVAGVVGDAADEAHLTGWRIVRATDGFPGVEMEILASQDPDDQNYAPNFAKALAGQDTIASAEPVFLVFSAQGVTPNDPDYGSQLGLQNINAGGAWAADQMGESHVLIGIVDSGMPVELDPDGVTLRPTHPDLKDPTALRPITLGTDFVAEWTPGVVKMNDGEGHGTHVLGIAAADSSNSKGIAGVNWRSPVYVTRVLDDASKLVAPSADRGHPWPIESELVGTASGVVWAIVEIVKYVRSNPGGIPKGMKAVINLSLWADGPVDAIREAFEYARQDLSDPSKGDDVLICVAAGNELGDSPSFPGWLGADFKHVVTVGSTNEAMTAMSTDSAHGTEITVVAPGDDIYSTDLETTGHYSKRSGTSMATAFVTGVASLMWSQNPALTPSQIKSCLQRSSTKSIPSLSETLGPPFDYPAVDAGAAVRGVDWFVEPESLNIPFLDVEPEVTHHRNIALYVHSCVSLTFKVVEGPLLDAASSAGSSFSISGSDTYPYSPDAGGMTGSVDIRVDYLGDGEGQTASGTITIECVEMSQRWIFYLTASTQIAQKNAVMLALDMSGSMDQPSGFPGMKRYEVLRESLLSLIPYVPDANEAGIIRFDHIANPVSPIGPVGPQRPALMGTVGALTPNLNGYTSIGNALDLAETGLGTLSADYVKATIVMTDGEENRPRWIEDVMPFTENPVYAVAMGTPQNIDTVALTELAGQTGGYVLLTGDLHGEDRFKMLKYYMQIYTNILGNSVVVDPHGRITPGRPIEVPFCVNEGDQYPDVVLMTTLPDLIDFRLVTPGGDELDGSAKGIEEITGPIARCYRCDLKRLGKKGAAVHGAWRAVIRVKKKAFAEFKKSGKKAGDPMAARGVPYNIVVQSRSPLKMRCRLLQSGFEPGDTLTLRAAFKDGGLPVTSIDDIGVIVDEPDHTHYRADLKPMAPGCYEVTIPTDEPGIYVCRFIARGIAADHRPFMREQTLTGAVWYQGNTRSHRGPIRALPYRISHLRRL